MKSQYRNLITHPLTRLTARQKADGVTLYQIDADPAVYDAAVTAMTGAPHNDWHILYLSEREVLADDLRMHGVRHIYGLHTIHDGEPEDVQLTDIDALLDSSVSPGLHWACALLADTFDLVDAYRKGMIPTLHIQWKFCTPGRIEYRLTNTPDDCEGYWAEMDVYDFVAIIIPILNSKMVEGPSWDHIGTGGRINYMISYLLEGCMQDDETVEKSKKWTPKGRNKELPPDLGPMDHTVTILDKLISFMSPEAREDWQPADV